MFHPTEQSVGHLPARQEASIPLSAARALLRSGWYDPHFGMLPGRHYRRRVGDGCLHLRVSGRQATLHWDEWDPRRYPVRHWFEVPILAGATVLLGVVAIGAAVSSATQRRT